ncbi:hypothetical protein BJ165DRAFT_976023 [Panaeolus papilionaceus]|nr:hypothetical protein BJ165DRAFT_976023 [Panaeolus papilionaceus]
MTHSTTGTFTYAISKYSRSYPTARSAQRTSAANSGLELASEWQHFTNPVIRLVLDIKTRTTTNELESVRLRVLWRMDTTEGTKETEVTFANLDLLALSFLPSLGPNKNHLEGLPLKAVYRDTVVGIRYLYSQEDPASPIFRRFQLSFQSSVEASAFIDSIRPICPCKMNAVGAAQPNPGLRSMMTMNPPPNRAPTSIPPAARGDLSALKRTSTVNSSAIWTGSNMTSAQHPVVPSLSISSSPLRQQSLVSPVVPLNSCSSNTYNPPPLANHSFPIPNVPHMYPAAIQSSNMSLTDPVVLPPSSLPIASPQDPESRQPTVTTMCPTTKTPIVAALSECSSVYDLPPSALEQIVAEVIREDGFLELVRRLVDIVSVHT